MVCARTFDIGSDADDVVDLSTFCCSSEQSLLFDSRIECDRKRNLVWRKAECAFTGGISRGPHWGVPNNAKPNERASWTSLPGRLATSRIPCNLGVSTLCIVKIRHISVTYQ